MTPELHDEMMRAKGVGVILATSSIVYKVPVKYPDALTVGCRIAEWKVPAGQWNTSDERRLGGPLPFAVPCGIAQAGEDGRRGRWVDGNTTGLYFRTIDRPSLDKVVYDYRLNKKTAAPHYLKSALESINTRRFDANGHPVVSKPSSQQHHHHTKPEAKHT